MKFESIKNNSKLIKFATNQVKTLHTIKGGCCDPTGGTPNSPADHVDITVPNSSGGNTSDGYGGGSCCTPRCQ